MKKILVAVVFVLVVFILLGLLYYDRINRLFVVNSFFEKGNIEHNFQDIEDIFPTTDISPSSIPLSLPVSLSYSFPDSFVHDDIIKNTRQFIDETRTEGLLVIHNDTIIYENYGLGLEPNEKHVSWSMSKSFIGTMIGVAVEKGLLNITDNIIDHLPEFAGTGYEGVTVEDLLQMRSGVRYNEDYGDYNSDIIRFGRAFALGTSYRSFAQSLVNEVPPGSRCEYRYSDARLFTS